MWTKVKKIVKHWNAYLYFSPKITGVDRAVVKIGEESNQRVQANQGNQPNQGNQSNQPNSTIQANQANQANQPGRNEIEEYIMARYISTNTAIWR